MSAPAKLALAAVGVGLLAALTAGGSAGAILDGLAIGWARHAARVLPRVRVDADGLVTLLACLVLSAALGHRFLRWLWRGRGHEEPWRARWTAAGLAAVVVLFAAGLAFAGAAHQVGWLLGRSARRPVPDPAWHVPEVQALIQVAEAQERLRERDLDLNGVHDYGRREISRIPDLASAAAAADDARKKAPVNGCWLRALRFPGEGRPDPRRYAACAYPASAEKKWMYIISHENRIWRKAYSGAPPDVFPADPAADGWRLMH